MHVPGDKALAILYLIQASAWTGHSIADVQGCCIQFTSHSAKYGHSGEAPDRANDLSHRDIIEWAPLSPGIDIIDVVIT